MIEVFATTHRSKSPSPPAAPNKAVGRSQVKGVAFRTVLWSLESLHGPSRVKLALEHMSEEAKRALHYGTVVPGGWYPVEWYSELLQAVVKASDGGVEIIRSIAVLSVEHDIKGVYRFFVEHLSPATIVALYAKLFPRYYTTGKILVEREGSHQFTLCVHDSVGFTGLMWQEIYASGRHLLTLSGASNIRHCITEGGRDGDAHMIVDARWE